MPDFPHPQRERRPPRARRSAGNDRRLRRVAGTVAIHLYEMEYLEDQDTATTSPTPSSAKGSRPARPATTDNPEEAWDEAVHPDDREAVDTAVELLNNDQPAEVEYRLVGYDGRTRWVWDRDAPAADARRTPARRRDRRGRPERKKAADALEEARRELQHIAFHDPLTGLPNRASFQEKLDAAIGRCPDKACAVGVLYIDLDNFKLINDSFGHAAGDELLCALQAASRPRRARATSWPARARTSSSSSSPTSSRPTNHRRSGVRAQGGRGRGQGAPHAARALRRLRR